MYLTPPSLPLFPPPPSQINPKTATPTQKKTQHTHTKQNQVVREVEHSFATDPYVYIGTFNFTLPV